MSCSSLIRASEGNFNLAQKILKQLSESYNFDYEEGWKTISTNTVQQLTKKFRRLRKANNPLSSVKKPRTAFSFFTKAQRANIQKKNPNASFGDLSKLVSKEWQGLSEKEHKKYKNMETEDKVRYEKEKCEVLANLPEQTETPSSDNVEEDAPQKPKKTSKSSSKPSKASKEKTSSSKSASSKSASTKTVKSSGKKNSKSQTAVGSYNVFQKKERSGLKKQFPDLGLKDINSKLGEMWQGLSASEKAVYV